MAIVKSREPFAGALLLQPRATSKGALRIAAGMGAAWGGFMTLFVGVMEWLSGASFLEIIGSALPFLLGGALYGMFMFPLVFLLLRPTQHVLPARDRADCHAMLAALDAALLKARFAVLSGDGAQDDYRHYVSTRRLASKLLQVRVLLSDDCLVVIGPTAAVRNVLRKSKLWKRRKR